MFDVREAGHHHVPLLLSPYRLFDVPRDVTAGLRLHHRNHADLESIRQVERAAGQGRAARPGRTKSSTSRSSVGLEGAFEPVYAEGDNTSCLATDTMKNTVYAFARQDPIDHVEAFASRLAGHFAAKPGVTLARIEAVEHPWTRLSVGGQPHPHAFVQAGAEAVDGCRHAERGHDVRRSRRTRPRRAEDDRFGVRGLPARRVHDAAGDARSHAGDVDHGDVAVPRRASPTSARATPSAARSSRPSPRTRASRCSTRCTRWAKPPWRCVPASPRSRCRCRTGTTCWSI